MCVQRCVQRCVRVMYVRSVWRDNMLGGAMIVHCNEAVGVLGHGRAYGYNKQ